MSANTLAKNPESFGANVNIIKWTATTGMELVSTLTIRFRAGLLSPSLFPDLTEATYLIGAESIIVVLSLGNSVGVPVSSGNGGG
jgi:hypothetical protein